MQRVIKAKKGLPFQLRLQSKIAVFCFLLVVTRGALFSQDAAYNHPELKWQTIETEHFAVHFHQGELRTAEQVAKIAEDVYKPISSLYNYEPDTKVHFIIKDYDDNSNGASYYYDNKIEIWAPPMDFHLRGTHNWLRDVVTHEFTHIISLGAARKFTRRIPAVYFQWIGYEKEKRKDVIHGYPNRIVSFPFSGTIVPMWFAEGMAQYQRMGLGNDWWDSFRDMVLRSAVLNREMLSISEMDVFGSSSIRNERVYNQGLALTIYISKKYGEDKVADLARAMSSTARLDFSSAVKKVLGKTDMQLYAEWKMWLEKEYLKGTEKIKSNIRQGNALFTKGSGNFNPVFDPEGRRIAFLSNHGSGYFSRLDLIVYDMNTDKSKIVSHSVDMPASWSPDGKKIVFGKRHRIKHGSLVYDLYILNLSAKKEKLITKGMRARSPSWSPNGKKIVCVVEKDGTSNLMLLNPDGKDEELITDFSCGEKIYTPHFTADGSTIVFTFSKNGKGRDVASVSADGKDFRYLIKTKSDERDAFPGRKDKYVYFSSDSTGIFNIYRYEKNTKKIVRMTNVTGGAFMPSVNSEGKIVCSVFGKKGYKIRMLAGDAEVDDSSAVYNSPYWAADKKPLLFSDRHTISNCMPDTSSLKPGKYVMTYSKMLFFPRLVMDFPDELKLGAYFTSSDILDRFSLMGGAAVNRLADIDLFGVFTYRKFIPTLFVEMYHQVRHTSELTSDFRFNLTEIDLGADWRAGEKSAFRSYYAYTRYNARMTYTDRGIESKFSYTYHIGSRLGVRIKHTDMPPSKFSFIAPNRGRKIDFTFEHAWNKFLNGFEINSRYGTIVGTYDKYSFNRYMVDWHEYIRGISRRHGVMIRLKAGIVDGPVDDFYNFFAGGLDGLKGYPFYSIEGRKMLQMAAAYRMVLWPDMKMRMGFLQLRNFAVSVYGEAGNAWNKGWPDFRLMKRDIGMQFRLDMNAFYSFPMRFFVDVAYGLDKFVNRKEHYGNEYRTYIGLLFDFPD